MSLQSSGLVIELRYGKEYDPVKLILARLSFAACSTSTRGWLTLVRMAGLTSSVWLWQMSGRPQRNLNGNMVPCGGIKWLINHLGIGTALARGFSSRHCSTVGLGLPYREGSLLGIVVPWV